MPFENCCHVNNLFVAKNLSNNWNLSRINAIFVSKYATIRAAIRVIKKHYVHI